MAVYKLKLYRTIVEISHANVIAESEEEAEEIAMSIEQDLDWELADEDLETEIVEVAEYEV